MNVSLHASLCDISTKDIMFQLQEPFEKLSKYLTQEYGGEMENLWIDLNLSVMSANSCPPFPFRFQKRVSGKSKIISGVKLEDSYNVGNYGVLPDFKILQESTNPLEYVMKLMYDSTAILIDKKSKFKGFKPEKFRAEFIKGCEILGYVVKN
ncbi:MAG: hypothetical protein GQ574_06960 [Crocinitomix sp.]|nr:hypothetical protein [Crocinitomix sp.]